MLFRHDVNGIRAIAVLAVVLFHFNESWLPGGFVGVDVFFVISGYLMTAIIFKGIENNSLDISNFYIARFNRIFPALAFLVFALMLYGLILLAPNEYATLAKHSLGSISFTSNVMYYFESGYFDATSREKWLLHTWSLSAEWQFYIIYPLVIYALSRFATLENIKKLIIVATIIGFALCVVGTIYKPEASYFLLPTRAWEMMVGGVAYLYPVHIKEKHKTLISSMGLLFIAGSCLMISEKNMFPGYLAFFPVLGCYLVIQANDQNNKLLNNVFSQKVGLWSYSIYLWHWPIVVGIYYYSLSEYWLYIGVIMSIAAGFLSYNFIEKYRPIKKQSGRNSLKKSGLIYVICIVAFPSLIYAEKGLLDRSSESYQFIIKNSESSPLRRECHISEYRKAEESCEYFSKENVNWAAIGDSHVAEIAYVLAEKLKSTEQGLKHFSYSGCMPFYIDEEKHKCTEWYNESIKYILDDDKIRNVVLNHALTFYLMGSLNENIKDISSTQRKKAESYLELFDNVVLKLASQKDAVYLFYPIPELPKSISQLVGLDYKSGNTLESIKGLTLDDYEFRNQLIIEHFSKAKYPENVHILDSRKVFCDDEDCLAVKDGMPLYFDDNHPSLIGAEKVIDLIKL